MNSITDLAKIIKQGVFPRVLKNEQDIEKIQEALKTLDLVDVKQAIKDWNDIIYKRQIIKINGKNGKDSEPEVVAGILKNDAEFLEYLKGEDGCDGEDYVLSDKDKKEIADLIEVPVVEKVIEKTETIIEQPIVTENIVEVAKYETADEIAKKLDSLKGVLSIDVIKGLREILVQLSNNTGGGNTTQVVNRFVRILDGSGVVRENASEITFGSGLTVTSTPNGIQVTALGGGGSGSGDVVGPASATDNAIARFDATSGKIIQNSSATIDDSGNISALGLALSSFTQGSIVFAGSSGVLSQDNTNFYWDDTNNRLGIGTNTPSRTFHVYGNTSGGNTLIERLTSATTGLAGTARFKAKSSGDMADTFGAQIAFDIEDDAGVSNEVGVIAVLRNGADNTSYMGFYTANAGTDSVRMRLDHTTLAPSINDGISLGTGALSWSDLFIASGGVLNFNNGDVTLTHSSNLLSLAGGNLALSDQTASRIAILDASKNLISADTATYPSLTELTYVKGVTSAIQTQLDAKIPTSYLDTDVTLSANSDAKIATQKAVKAYVDASVTGLLDLKGSTDCSANPNYPSALKGDAYYVTVAGKIGGASGKTVEIGDVYVALADNAGGTEASVGTSWFVLNQNLTGVALTSGTLAQFASTTSAQLAGVISDETGSGALVFATSPTLVTPALGTPSALVLTNATGLPLTGLVSDTTTALGVGSLNIGHASDTTLSRSASGQLAMEGVDILSISNTKTVTNKRNQPRVYTATNNASLTPEIDTYDIFHLTAMSANTTINNKSTSTPADGEQMRFRFLDNGSSITLTWGSDYVAKAGVALPTATTISKNLIVLFEWNANLSKWNCLATGLEA